MTQIELARKTASLDVIESIAKAFGVSYERLFKSNTIENKDILYALRLLEKDLTAAITEEIHNKFENLDV